MTLLGRNGMGKTTTIRSIMGLLRPRGGEVPFDGAAVTGREPYRVAQAGIGLVPEGRQIFPTLTVEENLVATAVGTTRHPPLDARCGLRPVPAPEGTPGQSRHRSSPAASSRCSPSAAR